MSGDDIDIDALITATTYRVIYDLVCGYASEPDWGDVEGGATMIANTEAHEQRLEIERLRSQVDALTSERDAAREAINDVHTELSKVRGGLSAQYYIGVMADVFKRVAIYRAGLKAAAKVQATKASNPQTMTVRRAYTSQAWLRMDLRYNGLEVVRIDYDHSNSVYWVRVDFLEDMWKCTGDDLLTSWSKRAAGEMER